MSLDIKRADPQAPPIPLKDFDFLTGVGLEGP